MASAGPGESLAKALTMLKCNGDEILEGSSFDWLFENPKLKVFLESFCRATEFSKISFLDDNQDKAHNECYKNPKSLVDNENEVESDIQKLRTQIKMKEEAKFEIINQQKMLTTRIHDLENKLVETESVKCRKETDFKYEQAKCLGVQKELSEILDNIVLALTEFSMKSETTTMQNETTCSNTNPNISNSFTSTPHYLSLEESYWSSLHGYMEKQFKKENQERGLSCNNLDDIQSFNQTSEGLSNFLKWRKELCRLKECLLTSKESLIRCQTTCDGLKAQIKILEDGISKNTPEQCLDVWQLKLKLEQATVKYQELVTQLTSLSREALPQEVLKFVNLVIKDVITANYDIKLKRQQYFLDKQANLFKLLLEQQSRLSVLHIAVQVEARKNDQFDQLFRQLVKDVTKEAEISRHCYAFMELLKIRQDIESSPPSDLASNLLADVIGKNEEELYISYQSMLNSAQDFQKKNEDLKRLVDKNSNEQVTLTSQISSNLYKLENMVTPLVLGGVETVELKQCLGTLEEEVDNLENTVSVINSSHNEKVKFLENSERGKIKREQLSKKFTV